MNQEALFPRKADYSNTRFPEPRAFQSVAHEQLREGLRTGHRRQLLVAPTGSGKTYIGLRIAHEALRKGKRALFLCDRTALINQTSARADDYGLTDHAIIQADHWRRDNSMPFQIASVQTIRDRGGVWPKSDVIIIDEAHTQYPVWKEHIMQTSAAVVGLTATPCSKGLGILFTNMVNAATMHELTTEGVLVPMRIKTCLPPDMAGAATASGEWTKKAAAERELQIVGDVIAEWLANGEGRKTIAFGANIAHCTELAQAFNAAGVVAECFTAKTPEAERAQLLREFAKPQSEIRILVSVEALAKGFDVQDIGCVIDARPLRKSLSTAIQMWGRGLRSSPDTGKTDCLLLDHSGNIRRFYDDFSKIYLHGFKSLDMAEKLDSVIRKEEPEFTAAGCPQCHATPFRERCLKCGFEKRKGATVEAVAGEMRDMQFGRPITSADNYQLWQEVCYFARSSGSPPEKQPGRAFYLYRDITGHTPPREFVFATTEGIPPSRKTQGKITSLKIAWRRSQKASAKADQAQLP